MHTSLVQAAVLALGAAATLAEAGTQAHGPRRLGQHHQIIKKSPAAVAEAQPQALEKRQAFTGKGSYYDPETGNQGACGGFIRKNDWVVALNTQQWDGGSHCGQQVTIHWKGQTQVATIRDQCPGCGWGGLDMTPGLFASLEPLSTGIIQVSWDFGSGSPPPPPPPPPTTHWTPDPTPEWTPTTTWRPSSTWTPSTTWHQEEQNTWTPSSSSSRWTSSSRSSSSSRTSTSSSSSSSLASSSSVSHNATSTATNATSTANSTLSSTGTASHTSGVVLPTGSGASNSTAGPQVGAGSLHNLNQAVLQMAGLIVDSVKA